MNLPPLHGTCTYKDFFVYAACDSTYFDEFASAFVGSLKANSTNNIHLHIFNPEPQQLDFCQQQHVSVSWEHVPLQLFQTSAHKWSTAPQQEPELTRYQRTLNAMSKGGDQQLIQRMQKTYYACARFIRLASLYQNTEILAMDIDAVIRKPLVTLGPEHDFYIHHISGRRARYLAGGIWLNPNRRSEQFLNQYAAQLQTWLEQDYVYWGLDQDLLDNLVPQYNHAQLPMEYIDWNMRPDSYIWTAKGTRKELGVFVNEQQKYVV
jgi:hypothetical protein